MAQIIDGKAIALKIREELKEEVEELEKQGVTPGLAVVLVGEDPASKIYVKNKKKAAEKAGIQSFEHHLPEDTPEAQLLELIERLNRDDSVHGILVQLPLPKHIDTTRVIEAISPDKDVDGFHPYNVGRLATGSPLFEPCTPKGIMELLKRSNIEVAGRDAVVVGRSNIVGKPVALMLLSQNATVTVCHSKTRDIEQKIGEADIVVCAVGRAEFVKGEWIKEGSVVIDVGINRLEDGRLVGDVEFEEAAKRASHITPVPGGVGPMTIAMLLANTVLSAKRTIKG